jgi:hypothetical protein
MEAGPRRYRFGKQTREKKREITNVPADFALAIEARGVDQWIGGHEHLDNVL